MQKSEMDIQDAIVLGIGMCGIACGAGLKTFGIDKFIMLEKGDDIGHFWQNMTYDSMALHNPHQDLPYDHGLTFKYSKYKSKHELNKYLNEYANLYDIRSHMIFNCNIVNISKNSDDIWVLKSDTGKVYHSKYLCLCTSMNRVPRIGKELKESMGNWDNDRIIHSMYYKNGLKYAGKNVLIIGNGNSAFEIARNLYDFKANKISIVSTRPRHVLLLNDLNKTIFGWKNTMYKWLGYNDLLYDKIFRFTYRNCGDKFWEMVEAFPIDEHSLDLQEFGIKKPDDSVGKEAHKGNLPAADWDNGAVPLIRTGEINIITKRVKEFKADGIIVLESNQLLSDYDDVILCTGYYHGLDLIFDSKLYNKLFDISPIKGSYWGIVPKTDGYNKSSMDNSLYFVGILGDYCLIGGMGNGHWGWNCARNIAKDMKIYDKNNEPNILNSINKRIQYSLYLFSFGCIAMSFIGVKYIYQKRKEYINTHFDI